MTDVQKATSSYLVRDNVRQVIEKLEPNKHQFEPVHIQWKDGSDEGTGEYYWFYPLNRIDGMDHKKTTYKLHRERSWKYFPGAKYVVNLTQVGECHAWVDKRINAGTIFVSEVFKQAMDDAGVTGFGYGLLQST